MKHLIIYISVIVNVSVSFGVAHSSYWIKTYGSNGHDISNTVISTTDGNFLVSGCINTFSSGNSDLWLLKIDADGNIRWQKRYGGENSESFYTSGHCIHQTTEGGYIVAGNTTSFGAGFNDFWIINLDRNGNVLWQKTYGTYGGDYNDEATSIQQTSDGGFIAAGHAETVSGNLDMLVLRLDANGNVVWQKTYAGNENDIGYAYAVQQTSDAGFILSGESNNSLLLIKLDESGGLQWQKRYSGSISPSVGTPFQQTVDGYIIAANTNGNEVCVLKLDSNGDIEWQKYYGGTGKGYVYSIGQTADEGFVVAGDVNLESGTRKGWIMKLAGNGDIVWQKTYGINYESTISGVLQTSDTEYIAVGFTSYFFGASGFDIWMLKLDNEASIPSCGIVDTHDAIASIAGVTAQDVSVTVSSIDLFVTNTGIIPQMTSAYTSFMCCYDDQDLVPPPNGNGIGDLCDCEGNFDCDDNCDGADAAIFKADFGRSTFQRPCIAGDTCKGDFTCDGDVDGTDASMFKSDFGRSAMQNPCPVCVAGEWCSY